MDLIVSEIIIAIILICLLFYTYSIMIQKVNLKIRYSRSMLLGTLSVIFLCVFIYMIILIKITGRHEFVIYSLLMLVSLVSFVIGGIFIIRNWKTVDKKMLLCFVCFFIAVMYITILSRRGTVESTIKMETFSDLKTALQTHSWEPVGHFLLNMIMFVPLGFFLSGIKKGSIIRLGTIALQGITISTVIETTQLLFHWGECDINDIIANSIGAVIGWIILKIFIKTEIVSGFGN